MESRRNTAQFVLGCVCTVCGIILLFVGCFLPPVGEISSSILVAFGEVCTFAGALIGVDYHYRYRFDELKEREREFRAAAGNEK